MGGFRLNLIAAGVAALIAGACLFAGASADDGDMAVVTLRPGVNEIGWISAPMPIEQLYDEIPELETVLHWDRRALEWVELRRRPGRDAPFTSVRHGVSLRLVIGSDEPVEWERPIRPIRGTIQLKTGVNFAPWGGRSGTPAWDALRGVGGSLVAAARWDAERQEWESLPAAPPGEGDVAAPTLARGDALWVAVTRNVNWLQPTYESPTLVFGSRVSAEDRTRARENLDFVMQFSTEHYGIQAEFSDLNIFIPHDVASLYRMSHSAGLYYRWSTVERFLDFGAWGGQSLMFSAVHGVRSIAENPTYTTWLHEYVHAIQSDLAGSPFNAAAVPNWLTEGTAMHSNSDQLVANGSSTWEDRRWFYELHLFDRDVSDLAEFERCVRCGEHQIGWLAADWLAARAGRESLIEFWRLLPPQGAGRVPGSPEVRWRWAFEDAFGLSAGEYYAEFRRWSADLRRRLIEEERGKPDPTPWTGPDPDAPWLSGKIVRAPGAVAVLRISVGPGTGVTSSTVAADDGSFRLQAVSLEPHYLRMRLDNGCWMWVGEDGLATDSVAAKYFSVSAGDVTDIIITIPPEACQAIIAGRVAAPVGTSLIRVLVGGYGAELDDRGGFERILPLPGEYRVEVQLDDGCRTYYAADGATAQRDQAEAVVARDRERVEVDVRIPAGLCLHRFSGSVSAAAGSALPLPRRASIRGEGQSSPYVDLDADGSFDLVTSQPGPYYLTFEFGQFCRALFDGRKLSFSQTRISIPRVLTLEPGDGIEVRLPRALPDRCTLDAQARRDG